MSYKSKTGLGGTNTRRGGRHSTSDIPHSPGPGYDSPNFSGAFSGRRIQTLTNYQCIECNSACIDGEHDCIQCYTCKKWCHKSCTKYDKTLFEHLSDSKKPNLQHVCTPCMNSKAVVPPNIESTLNSLLGLIPMMTDIRARLENVEKSFSLEGIEKKLDEMVDQKVKEVMEEKLEIEKRERNLIIVNLPESDKPTMAERTEDDIARISLLYQGVVEFTPNDIEDIARVGSQGGNRSRLVKLTLKTRSKKIDMLKKSSDINQAVQGENRVYINQDLTPKQRDLMKDLTKEKNTRNNAEGKKEWVIRNFTLVKKNTFKSDKESHKLNQATGGPPSASSTS